jgi:histidinol-phosphatase
VWDYAPVQIVVEEAGGKVTTLDGGAPTDGESLVSTNGVLHDEVVSILGTS